MSRFHNNGKGVWISPRPDTFPNGSSRRPIPTGRREGGGFVRPSVDDCELDSRPPEGSRHDDVLNTKLDRLLDRFDKLAVWRDDSDRKFENLEPNRWRETGRERVDPPRSPYAYNAGHQPARQPSCWEPPPHQPDIPYRDEQIRQPSCLGPAGYRRKAPLPAVPPPQSGSKHLPHQSREFIGSGQQCGLPNSPHLKVRSPCPTQLAAVSDYDQKLRIYRLEQAALLSELNAWFEENIDDANLVENVSNSAAHNAGVNLDVVVPINESREEIVKTDNMPLQVLVGVNDENVGDLIVPAHRELEMKEKETLLDVEEKDGFLQAFEEANFEYVDEAERAVDEEIPAPPSEGPGCSAPAFVLAEEIGPVHIAKYSRPAAPVIPLPPPQCSPCCRSSTSLCRSAAPLPAAAAAPSLNLPPLAPPCSPDIIRVEEALLDDEEKVGSFANLRPARVRGEKCSSLEKVDQNELLRTHCFKFGTLEELVNHSPPTGEDLHGQRELLEQQTYRMTSLNKAANLKKPNQLVTSGFQNEVATDALYTNENDGKKGLEDLTNPEANVVLKDEIMKRLCAATVECVKQLWNGAAFAPRQQPYIFDPGGDIPCQAYVIRLSSLIRVTTGVARNIVEFLEFEEREHGEVKKVNGGGFGSRKMGRPKGSKNKKKINVSRRNPASIAALMQKIHRRGRPKGLNVGDVPSTNHRSTSLDTDARLIPPRNGKPCLSILGGVNRLFILVRNFTSHNRSPWLIFYGGDEGTRSAARCVFDPGGDVLMGPATPFPQLQQHSFTIAGGVNNCRWSVSCRAWKVAAAHPCQQLLL